jgi:Domain of unknown function (DUF4326)
VPDTPRRIQLSRRKGFRLPEGAVVVARPTYWGNPFKVGEKIKAGSDLWPYVRPMVGEDLPGFHLTQASFLRIQDVIAAYSAWILEQPGLMVRMPGELAGRDLACWCKPADPCHADLLLALANGWDMPPEPTAAIFTELEAVHDA